MWCSETFKCDNYVKITREINKKSGRGLLQITSYPDENTSLKPVCKIKSKLVSADLKSTLSPLKDLFTILKAFIQGRR